MRGGTPSGVQKEPERTHGLFLTDYRRSLVLLLSVQFHGIPTQAVWIQEGNRAEGELTQRTSPIGRTTGNRLVTTIVVVVSGQIHIGCQGW